MSNTAKINHYTETDYMDDHIKEEWINGVKYMSPRPQYNHVSSQGYIFIALSNYFKSSCRVISDGNACRFISTYESTCISCNSHFNFLLMLVLYLVVLQMVCRLLVFAAKDFVLLE